MMTKSSDHYVTPPEIVDILYAMWGGPPDLDPCSAPHSHVRALIEVFPESGSGSQEHRDGLFQPWEEYDSGGVIPRTVYCNPPFSSPKPWVIQAAKAGRDGLDVVLMLNAQTAAAYWRRWVWATAHSVCFPSPRINFELNGEKTKSNRYDQAVAYWPGEGRDPDIFRRCWQHRGAIVKVL